MSTRVPLSILDLVRVTSETDTRGALDNARDVARHAEEWGYRRFWVAEHHNFPGIASAATSLVIAHVAAGCRTIRVGAGGIMLPNHAPLVVAVRAGMESLVAATGADELIVVSDVYDHAARLRSFEMIGR